MKHYEFLQKIPYRGKNTIKAINSQNKIKNRKLAYCSSSRGSSSKFTSSRRGVFDSLPHIATSSLYTYWFALGTNNLKLYSCLEEVPIDSFHYSLFGWKLT